MNYLEKFKDLISSLEKNTLIKVNKSKLNKPLDKFGHEFLKDDLGIILTTEISPFYNDVNGCNIEWEINLNESKKIKKYFEDDAFISGRIKIFGVGNMLMTGDVLNSEPWLTNADETEVNDLINFRAIDYNDDSLHVGFLVEGKQIDTELVYMLDESDGLSKLPLTFDEYLEKMIEYKGYQGWVYNHLFQNNDMYERMKYYLNQIF